MRGTALVFILATTTSLFSQSSSSYRVTHTCTLGGDGGWDYAVYGLGAVVFCGHKHLVQPAEFRIASVRICM
jgi:hypothetical protein